MLLMIRRFLTSINIMLAVPLCVLPFLDILHLMPMHSKSNNGEHHSKCHHSEYTHPDYDHSSGDNMLVDHKAAEDHSV